MTISLPLSDFLTARKGAAGIAPATGDLRDLVQVSGSVDKLGAAAR